MITLPVLIACAIGYGVTMKVADLLNEHGLKWFAGAPLLFGILWGLFGAALVLADNTLANIILAMNLAFIIRGRLDYLNHQVAATLIFFTFLFHATVMPTLLLPFFFIFLSFGWLKDYVDDVLKKSGILPMLTEAMLYYPVPAFIYCYMYGNWSIFWVFLFYTISYNLTKYVAKQYGYR